MFITWLLTCPSLPSLHFQVFKNDTMSELMGGNDTELTAEKMQAIFGRAIKPIAERKGITFDDADAAPKKRGRPRKVKDEDTDAGAAPKKRGRPPKAKDNEDADAAPKKRGRPPKAKDDKDADAAPKKRGRPRKVQVTEAEQSSDSDK